MKKITITGVVIITLLSFMLPYHLNAQSTGKIKTLSVQKFHKNLIGTKNAQLIDVRTPEEYEDGHLRDAINYNVMDSTLEKNIDNLNKKKPVFVYCQAGVRSQKAAELLEQNGFKVFNLAGGFDEWLKAKLPTTHSEF